MVITSPVFEEGEPIPEKYTCDNINVNPPLIFSEIPDDAIALSLLITDPDASQGEFIHWIVFDINPTVRTVDEDSVPEGGILGTNDSGQMEYTGPCPPSGTHHYIFRLYAQDDVLGLDEGTPAREVLDALQSVVLETTELIGTYTRKT